MFAATNELKHVADVKVGKVKGNSKVYPQLRFPSRYADLAGATASVYDISGGEGDSSFIIAAPSHAHSW